MVRDQNNLPAVGKNERGCLPIFHVEIVGHWKKAVNSKTFEPARTVRMVYKGLPNIIATKEVKKDYFRNLLKKKEQPTETQINTFSIVSYTLLHHLGYEVKPSEKI